MRALLAALVVLSSGCAMYPEAYPADYEPARVIVIQKPTIQRYQPYYQPRNRAVQCYTLGRNVVCQ